MKKSLAKLLLISSLALFAANAHAIDSNYVGPSDGNWSKPSNWSPAKVPDNRGHRSFDVSLIDLSVVLNIDPTITSLTLGGDSLGGVTSVDHSLVSLLTRVAPATAIDFTAMTADVLFDAGELTNFSGTTLSGGGYVLDAAQGRTATLRFTGADIRTNSAYIFLLGTGAQIVNENNDDALTYLSHLTPDGEIDLQSHPLSSAGSFVNEGFIFADKSLWTFDGDFTDIGDRRDPGTVGFLFGLGRQSEDARFVVTGVLTNYDAASHTLNKGRFLFNAASSGANTLQVLGGDLLDIVTNNGAVILYGPNTGLLDKNGDDALRHLAVINRDLEVGSRDFTTAGDLLVNDSLVIFGDSRFTVSGNLTSNGFLLFSPFNAYALNFVGYPGVPTDRMALNTKLNVAGDLTFGPENTFNLEIFGAGAKGAIKVTGQATLDGTLAVTVLDEATVTSNDKFVVLTAARLNGTFANVANGQRIDAQDLNGETAGSFLVSYQGKRLILSAYLPASSNSLPSLPARTRDRTSSSRE